MFSTTYHAAAAFIQAVLDYNMQSISIFNYCTSYITKTLTSASCMLLKLLNSSIAQNFDTTQGRTIFNSCILAIRSTSVKKRDFSERVAEVLSRMWRVAGGGFDVQINGLREPPLEPSDPLDLKIRSRMHFSHVYDAIWRWRGTIGHAAEGE